MYNEITINENEASLKKEPERFDKLTYDNEHNKLFDQLDLIGSMVRRIDDDVERVNSALNTLESKYGNETAYIDYIDDARSVLNSSNEDVGGIKSHLLRKIRENIERAQSEDIALLSEINKLNNKLRELNNY
jgi:hypothetical protein